MSDDDYEDVSLTINVNVNIQSSHSVYGVYWADQDFRELQFQQKHSDFATRSSNQLAHIDRNFT